ncbi:hypothetical protein FPOAC2_11215 [Fusarium poae]
MGFGFVCARVSGTHALEARLPACLPATSSNDSLPKPKHGSVAIDASLLFCMPVWYVACLPQVGLRKYRFWAKFVGGLRQDDQVQTSRPLEKAPMSTFVNK